MTPRKTEPKRRGRKALAPRTALGLWLRTTRAGRPVPILAERAGITTDYWYRLESGHSPVASGRVRLLIAAALGVSVKKMP